MRPASEILNLRAWARRKYRLDGWWASVQLDHAVTWVGRYVENKLMERDTEGHELYDLDVLLSDGSENENNHLNTPEGIAALKAMFGAVGK